MAPTNGLIVISGPIGVLSVILIDKGAIMATTAYIIILIIGILNLFALFNKHTTPAGAVTGFIIGWLLIAFSITALVIT